MTRSLTVEPTISSRRRRFSRHFFRHAAEMAVAMTVGMALLGPVWVALLGWVGLGGALARPDLAGLVAATDMTVAMAVWMRYRGHGRAAIVEMAAAMYVPYLVLIVPWWLGMLPGEDVTMGGHALMLPAMAVAMLVRREEYSRPHGSAHSAHPLIGVLGKRWPTWVGLALTLDFWQDPSVPPPWLMVLLPTAYLVFGGLRGHLRDPRLLALQLAGLALYVVLIVVAVNAGPTAAAWIVAAGFGFHALWDLAHHRADVVAPRWYTESCAVVDAVIAITIVLFWL
jgi:hypothetical protein